MEEHCYTLNDPLFRYGLRKGSETEIALPEERRLMLVGGAATQLLMREDTHLLRPTNDIDLIVDGFLRRCEKINWAKYLSEQVKADGFPNKRRLPIFGAEVKFKGIKDELSVHLDCFDRDYHKKNSAKIAGEFERAEITDYNGCRIRCQHPMDIIVNKSNRIISLNLVLGLPLSRKARKLIDLIKKGQFDDLDVDKDREDLDSISFYRRQTVEDLARLSPYELQMQVQGYKIRTDAYDILSVVEALRKQGKTIDRKEFLDALKTAVVNSTST